MQVEMKGRVNIDKLTSFLEDLRVSKNRTVSLGALMCASDASAADSKHVAEVRCSLRAPMCQAFWFCLNRLVDRHSPVMATSCPTILCARTCPLASKNELLDECVCSHDAMPCQTHLPISIQSHSSTPVTCVMLKQQHQQQANGAVMGHCADWLLPQIWSESS